LTAAVKPEPFLTSIIPSGLNRTPVARSVYASAEEEDSPLMAFTEEAEGVASKAMRNVDPCRCDSAVLAHEPEEYAHEAASAEAALVATAASKITKIKSVFQIFQQPSIPDL
jgi:hypothetical protein